MGAFFLHYQYLPKSPSLVLNRLDYLKGSKLPRFSNFRFGCPTESLFRHIPFELCSVFLPIHLVRKTPKNICASLALFPCVASNFMGAFFLHNPWIILMQANKMISERENISCMWSLLTKKFFLQMDVTNRTQESTLEKPASTTTVTTTHDNAITSYSKSSHISNAGSTAAGISSSCAATQPAQKSLFSHESHNQGYTCS